MKKRILFLALALVLIASLVLAGCSSSTPTQTTPANTTAPATTAPASTTPASTTPVASGNVIKLKYADQNPPTGWEGSQAAQPWLDQVEAATNGRVKFETYYSQSLFKGADSWTSVKNGIGDAAWMWHGYWANLTTLADVVSLPFMPFKSAKQASGILWKLYEKYPTLAGQFDDNQVLVTFASEPYFLITRNKQIKTVDDIKGMQIRVAGGPPIEMVKALGATPVTKGMADTYLALQKGEMDGMAVCWEAMLSWRQYEVIQYVTKVPFYTTYFTVAVNKAKWNSIPDDVKAQINSVSGLQGSLFWGENCFDGAVTEGHKILQEKGVTLNEYTLSDEELAKWTAIAKPLWDSWVKKMTDAGHPEAQEILNTTLDLINTYNP